MKKAHLFILAMLLFLLAPFEEASSGKALYDDFSAQLIDSSKWMHREYVIEIVNGKLVTKFGNYEENINSSGFSFHDLSVGFVDPNSIYSIEAEVAIVDTIMDNVEGYSAKIVGGYFYNTNETGCATGDILALIVLGDFGNGGLEAKWEVHRVVNDEGSLELFSAENTRPRIMGLFSCKAKRPNIDAPQTFPDYRPGAPDPEQHSLAVLVIR